MSADSTRTAEELTRDPLWKTIVTFYRDEIARRYELDNIRRFDEFDHVSDAQALALRNYFLERIYPPIREREELDDALFRLRSVLTSPRRVRPFMKAGFKSMWKLGPSLPGALKAGVSVLDTYLKARALEAEMTKIANELGFKPGTKSDRNQMLEVIRHVPEKDVMKLVQDILALFHALSNTKMLNVAIEFLEKSREIMRTKPDLYSDADLAGIALGCELVRGGRDLFLEMDPEQFPVIIEGIEQVELDWYRSVTGATPA